jgi:hypothetical protein
MSQISFKEMSGTSAADVEFLTGDSGGPVGVDAAFNINILGGAGIDVVGDPITHTLTISSTDIETLTGDSGGPVGVDAVFNINILSGVGIDVVGDPITHTLTISDDDLVQGNVTTNNAVATDCIVFPLGVVAGTYVLDGRITAFNTTDVSGGSYFFSAGVRTTGAAGIIIGTSFGAAFEEVSMAPADFDIIVSGNNLVIQVIGIAGKTINWSTEFEYQFVGV